MGVPLDSQVAEPQRMQLPSSTSTEFGSPLPCPRARR